MNETVTELRDQALNSTYSADRTGAMESLADLYADAGTEARNEILRTFAEVAREATHGDEREQARERLTDLFRDEGDARTVVVDTFCRLALEGKSRAERTDSIDHLRHFQELGVPNEKVDRLRATYLQIIEESTYEDERRRARDGLTELVGGESAGEEPLPDELELGIEVIAPTGATETDREGSASSVDGNGGQTTYLAVSLAEHLDRARTGSPEDCLRRADELWTFVEQHPVPDDQYDAVCVDLEALVEQLESVSGTVDELDEERRERVERLADRTQRLYLRAT